MTSGSTARANITTEIISWIAIVIAGLILVLWLFRSGTLAPADMIELADKDLLQMQIMLDEACSSDAYRNTYNPLTEEGNLTITPTEVCIEMKTGSDESRLTRCASPVCDLGFTDWFDLAQIKELTLQKNGGFNAYG